MCLWSRAPVALRSLEWEVGKQEQQRARGLAPQWRGDRAAVPRGGRTMYVGTWDNSFAAQAREMGAPPSSKRSRWRLGTSLRTLFLVAVDRHELVDAALGVRNGDSRDGGHGAAGVAAEEVAKAGLDTCHPLGVGLIVAEEDEAPKAARRGPLRHCSPS